MVRGGEQGCPLNLNTLKVGRGRGGDADETAVISQQLLSTVAMFIVDQQRLSSIMTTIIIFSTSEVIIFLRRMSFVQSSQRESCQG